MKISGIAGEFFDRLIKEGLSPLEIRNVWEDTIEFNEMILAQALARIYDNAINTASRESNQFPGNRSDLMKVLLAESDTKRYYVLLNRDAIDKLENPEDESGNRNLFFISKTLPFNLHEGYCLFEARKLDTTLMNYSHYAWDLDGNILKNFYATNTGEDIAVIPDHLARQLSRRNLPIRYKSDRSLDEIKFKGNE